MITALILAAALAGAPVSDRLARCFASVEADAEVGYEEARAWVAEQGGPEALRCSAAAELARGRPARAATQFERLAVGAPEVERLDYLSSAGNAWLIAGDADRALSALDRALVVAPKEADLRIDRARAYALRADWRRAEEDLSAALDLRPEDVLALALRAETRLRQGAYDLAERDGEKALALKPDSVEAALSLGRAREAKRLGRAPE